MEGEGVFGVWCVVVYVQQVGQWLVDWVGVIGKQFVCYFGGDIGDVVVVIGFLELVGVVVFEFGDYFYCQLVFVGLVGVFEGDVVVDLCQLQCGYGEVFEEDDCDVECQVDV